MTTTKPMALTLQSDDVTEILEALYLRRDEMDEHMARATDPHTIVAVGEKRARIQCAIDAIRDR